MTMTIVMGIDPASTRLAFVALHDHGGYLAQKADNLAPRHGAKGQVLKTTKWSPVACGAAATITAQYLGVLEESWPDEAIAAYIESPLVGRGGVRTTMVQSFTSGAVQGVLANHGIPVTMVNVGTWKADVVGHGHATKDDVAEALRLRWPTFFSAAGGDQDLHDAACIALWGQEHLPDRGLGTTGSMPGAHR